MKSLYVLRLFEESVYISFISWERLDGKAVCTGYQVSSNPNNCPRLDNYEVRTICKGLMDGLNVLAVPVDIMSI